VRSYDARVTSRTKQLLLVLIALGWAALGVANIVRDRLGIGILYIVLGVISGAIALTVQTGRRSR
jgi:hypothetical protein